MSRLTCSCSRCGGAPAHMHARRRTCARRRGWRLHSKGAHACARSTPNQRTLTHAAAIRSMQDIEKLAAKKGVVLQSVKEVRTQGQAHAVEAVQEQPQPAAEEEAPRYC
jgi:hypothetical protein